MSQVWNNNEIDYLYEHVGSVRVESIAKRLNRPIEGVLLKMQRLNISNTKEQVGLLTMGTLAELLQVERNTVKNWADRHGLPVKKKKPRSTKTFYFIDPIEFWKWAFEHQDRIDFSKIEKNSIPPEPEWVNPLRYQKREIKGNYYREWTIKEEQRLLELRAKSYTYKEIAEALDRTPISIERKYKRLMKKQDEKGIRNF